MKRVALQCLCFLFAALAAPALADGEPARQVRVEARVLEWEKTSQFDFAFAAQYAGGSNSILQAADATLPADLASGSSLFLEGLSAGTGSLEAVIETLEETGRVRVLHQPSIILMDQGMSRDEINKPSLSADFDAKLANSTRIPYESAQAVGTTLASVTEYKDAGVTLNVSVLNTEDGLVTLDLSANVEDLTGYINIGTNDDGDPISVPTLNARSIQNRVISPDGGVFIAGVMKVESEIENREGLPWLGELPILNWFFANRASEALDRELIFLVRPEILHAVNPLLNETDPMRFMNPGAPEAM